MRRLITITAIATLALGASVALAAAGTQYPTAFTKFKYKLDQGEATFKGAITSPKGGCVKGRKVVLYRQHSGSTKKLGGDHTNKKGKFEIDLGSGPPRDGKYYAKVESGRLRLGYQRERFTRETVISASAPARLDKNGLTFKVRIEPHEDWSTDLDVVTASGAGGTYVRPKYASGARRA